MTTDIAELAQRVKTEASGIDDTQWYLAKPSEIRSLVEALEKAKTKADVYDMLRDDYGLREKGVGLVDFVDWQAQRIAELESGRSHE